MKTQKLKWLGLFAVLTLFSISCKEDEKVPDVVASTGEFTFGDQSINLDNANLYLYDKIVILNRATRAYYITDGTLIDGKTGWGAYEDFDNETFLMYVQIAVPNSNEVIIGDYTLKYTWNSPDYDDEKVAVLIMGTDFYVKDSEEFIEVINEDYNDTSNSPLKIMGGLNDGQTMELSFEGILTRVVYGSESTDPINPVTSKFYFKGKVKETPYAKGIPTSKESLRGITKN